MCQANLDLFQERISLKFGQDYYLPVFYFTELMGLALGHAGVSEWLSKHLVDPMPLLKQRGLV
jgi:heterodisulfide reductase subunit B